MQKVDLIEISILIRRVELKLLDLFNKGKIKGTIHTCVGQEYTGAVLRIFNDIEYNVFSNHRSHGHYIGKTNDVNGLINEIVGSEDGIVNGYGGSQHIYNKKGFFSNGILAGMSAVSAGYSFATNNLSILFIGDGALGEGLFYESLNIISKFNLKILIIFEDNKIAQSTNSNETFFGDIKKRIEGFGLKYEKTNIWDLENFIYNFSKIKNSINSNFLPTFLHVECNRLKAHSKGDDTRSPQEVKKYENIDPINIFKKENLKLYNEFENKAEEVINKCLVKINYKNKQVFKVSSIEDKFNWKRLDFYSDELVNKRIYHSFTSNLKINKNLIFLGEDIEHPYGGAFKVTKDLSKKYPNNVFNMPDSEAAIVGFGNGISLTNKTAICEIMFADFLSLIFDQWLNHATKFNQMYSRKIFNNIIVRTATGGRRGYGPTHSQNTEKYFYGIPGSQIIAINYKFDPKIIYDTIIKKSKIPTIVLENKLDYSRLNNKSKSNNFDCFYTNEEIPTLKISHKKLNSDITIVAWGGVLPLVEEAVEKIFINEEIVCNIIVPQSIYPLNIFPIVENLLISKKLIIIEDDTSFSSLGSEIISNLKNKNIDFIVKKINTLDQVIPNSKELENIHFPDLSRIVDEVTKFYLNEK